MRVKITLGKGFNMTKKEISVCEKTVNELMTAERESNDPVLTEKIRFARIGIMNLMNNLDYRVSIPEPGTVRIFRGDAL